MEIQHQNQGMESAQNDQIEICSLQLMEGNPSISWQYFHRLEVFHLLAFGYNWSICPKSKFHHFRTAHCPWSKIKVKGTAPIMNQSWSQIEIDDFVSIEFLGVCWGSTKCISNYSSRFAKFHNFIFTGIFRWKIFTTKIPLFRVSRCF